MRSCYLISSTEFTTDLPLRILFTICVNSVMTSSNGVLMFSLICAWINCWVNNGEAGDLRRHRAHYDVTVMSFGDLTNNSKTLTVLQIGCLISRNLNVMIVLSLCCTLPRYWHICMTFYLWWVRHQMCKNLPTLFNISQMNTGMNLTNL